MPPSPTSPFAAIGEYAARLAEALHSLSFPQIALLANDFAEARRAGHTVWICGNGGSAANAIHWANDFLYPVVKQGGRGIRIEALTANPAVLTCLGNDIGYDRVFSRQLETRGQAGDMLVVLSGSGNSPNILWAVEAARHLNIKTWGLVGFDGGKAKLLVDATIHFQTNDMQVAEDLQMAVCHMLVQHLNRVFQAD